MGSEREASTRGKGTSGEEGSRKSAVLVWSCCSANYPYLYIPVDWKTDSGNRLEILEFPARLTSVREIAVERRDYLFQNVALPLIVNIVGGILLAFAGLIAYKVYYLPLRITLSVGGGLLLGVALLTRRAIRRRYVTLKVLEDVSSSRCGDHFIRLATLLFRELAQLDEAMKRLTEVAGIRKYPNRRFLEDLQDLADCESGGKLTRRTTSQYLALAADNKRLARAEVVEAVSLFLRDLPADTQIVLYGYSSTICESLARCAAWLSISIFLIEDLQYGIEGSLGEHLKARAHLIASGLKPILLPFDQIAALCSPTADFVRNTAGHAVPLPSHRKIMALLGCEALSISGEILIPSQVRGTPSETAKFVEVFHQAAQCNSRQAEVVLVFESYKTYENCCGRALVSHAPLKASLWRDALYLVGLRRLHYGPEVELVRLTRNEVKAVIGDTPVYLRSDPFNIRLSHDLWRDRTVNRIKRRPPSLGLASVLAGKKAAIFDMDGVLMDDEFAQYSSFVDCLRTCEATLTYQEYLRHCSGRTDREGVENLLNSKHLSGDVDDLIAAKRASFTRRKGEYPLLAFPGAVQLARDLHAAGVQCFLVTASDKEGTMPFIRSCDLEAVFNPDHCFFETQSGERITIYREILRKSGVEPSACVLIDDSPENLSVGASLGMVTIGVATTHPVERIFADLVVNGPLGSPNDSLDKR